METKQPDVASAVDRFLSHGQNHSLEPASLAKAVDDRIRLEAQKSLKHALSLARQFVRRSENRQSPLLLTAYRALARVTHMSVKHAEAEKAYLHARRLAGSDALIKARIDRALIDVYMYLGDYPESRRRANLALAAFKRANATADIAMTHVNLGNLLHRQDKHRDAERFYFLASEYFQSVGDELSVARCEYNRANTLVQLFEFDQAEPLYVSARDIYFKNEFMLDGTDALYGLAWLAMLKGQFHIALTELAECEAAYRKFGQPKGAALCELDRAEVYLGLNLLTDALESSRSAEKQFQALGHRYELSKARLFRAKAAFGLGLLTEARQSARKAIEGFKIDHNDGFLGASYLVESQLSSDQKCRRSSLRNARTHFAKAQLPLWAAVCDLHDASQGKRASIAVGRLAANRAVKEVPHLFAWWQTLLGDISESDGRIDRARRHWQQAADRLDAVKAQLPPLELRARYATGTVSPHLRLIESQLRDSPREAAAWSERYKTAGIWAPLSSLDQADEVRQRAERSLVELAHQVAIIARRIGGLGGERGSVSTEAQHGLAKLQRQVRLELAAMERGATAQVDPVDRILSEIEETSKLLPVIQFHLTERDIVAFVHHQGATRLVRYRDGRSEIGAAMRQWRFLLESELLSKHLAGGGQILAEEKFFSQLAEKLWRPLEIGDRHASVLILPEGDLANLPWQALRVDSAPLLHRHQFILAPSLRHFLHARSIKVTTTRVDLFAGAADDLPMVKHELAGLAERSGKHGVKHLPATRADWPSDGESRLWHYSGHAHLRADNPFYSSLHLVDGPLFAADFRLRSVKVGLATLAACRSGQQVAMPGEESTGLVRSLLEMGARNVIAGHWPVSDESTAVWMHSFYEQYFDGQSLAKAARTAAETVREKFPSAYHWAAFAIHGAGE